MLAANAQMLCHFTCLSAMVGHKRSSQLTHLSLGAGRRHRGTVSIPHLLLEVLLRVTADLRTTANAGWVKSSFVANGCLSCPPHAPLCLFPPCTSFRKGRQARTHRSRTKHTCTAVLVLTCCWIFFQSRVYLRRATTWSVWTVTRRGESTKATLEFAEWFITLAATTVQCVQYRSEKGEGTHRLSASTKRLCSAADHVSRGLDMTYGLRFELASLPDASWRTAAGTAMLAAAAHWLLPLPLPFVARFRCWRCRSEAVTPAVTGRQHEGAIGSNRISALRFLGL